MLEGKALQTPFFQTVVRATGEPASTGKSKYSIFLLQLVLYAKFAIKIAHLLIVFTRDTSSHFFSWVLVNRSLQFAKHLRVTDLSKMGIL